MLGLGAWKVRMSCVTEKYCTYVCSSIFGRCLINSDEYARPICGWVLCACTCVYVLTKVLCMIPRVESLLSYCLFSHVCTYIHTVCNNMFVSSYKHLCTCYFAVVLCVVLSEVWGHVCVLLYICTSVCTCIRICM